MAKPCMANIWHVFKQKYKKSKKDDPKLCGLLHHSGSPFEDRR
jgi:hypothetical protein